MTRLARLTALALGAGILASLLNLPSAHAQVPTRTCGLTGLPACPQSVPIVSGWTFTTAATSKIFYSLDDLTDWFTGTYGPVNQWCNTTFSGTAPNSPPVADLYNFGIDVVMQYSAHFPTDGYTTTTPPCSSPFTSFQTVYQRRSVACPLPLSLTYHTSPSIVGPYCASSSAEQLAKAPGKACPCGAAPSNSGGADAGSSALAKGDPGDSSDVTSGNQYQSEVDYAGSGSNPLRFERSYNSLSAYNLEANSNAGGLTSQTTQALGVGWMADYFQWLGVQSVTDSAGSRTTVYAYRPDGRTLTFNLYSGVYVPSADVADILTQTVGGWQYQTANNTVETYDASGKLLTVAREGQPSVTVQYGSRGIGASLPASVSDPFGHTLQFAYAPDSTQQLRLASITDPAGNVINYAYNTYGDLLTATHADTYTRTYAYGESYHVALRTLTDESGVLFATWTYTGVGDQVLTSQRGAGINLYTFSYSGTNRTVVDPLGQSRTYGSQVIQGLSRVTTSTSTCSGCGEDKSRTYDANGNIATRTDFNNVQTHYAYDLNRNLETSRTEAYGTPRARTITTTWDPTYRLPATIVEPNRTTSFTYGAMGNTLTKTITDTSITPNVSRTWTNTYDTYRRILTANGPRTDVSDVTTYAYYTCTTGSQCGQLQTVTDPVGNVTTYNTYNAYGQPLTLTDPNGVLITLTYDLRQRLTSRQVGSELTSFSYYPTGLLKQVTLPDNSSLLYTYDAAHRLTQINDGLGNKVVYMLDAMGNRTAENAYDPSSVLHRTHSRVFNTLNQLNKDVNAAGTAAVTTTFGYDGNGNQTSIAAPLSRNTANAYDELNRLKQITDPASGITQFGYDASDNLLTATDPRTLVTSYTYDGFAGLKTLTSPDTGTTTNTHDSGGNLLTATDARGAVATYSYDALNRVTSVAYSLSGSTDQTIAFTYDASSNGRGHLTGASDANHSLAWSYDALGRIVSKSQTVGTVVLSVGYGYLNADLTSLTTASGQSVVYGYNSNHQVTSVTVNGTTVLSNATYEPLGPVSGWTWGNGSTASRTYDTDGKIAQVSSAGVKTLSYDNAFRITGISDTTPGSSNWTYGYDLLDRMTSSTNGSVTRGWTYDANGNRLTETGSAPSTYTISGTSNRISSIAGALARSYGYDAAGNTATYSTVSATYNDAGRLKTVVNGGVTETLVYNALGHRVKTSGGAAGTVLYAYDEAGHLLGEYDGSGALIEETVWLGDIPVATLKPNGASVAVFYVHTDQLNTPRQITRPSDNAQMWTWNSDPFGTDAANANPGGAGAFPYNVRFPGQIFDGQAGLHYNMARDFDPAVGKFVESDPIGLKGGANSPYVYAGSNPLLYADPSGLYQCTYAISTHLMNCIPNNPAHQAFSSDQFTAGNNLSPTCNDCQNNPAHTNVMDHGPIPVGAFTIGGQLPNSSRRPLTPLPATQMFGRFGMQLHGCGNAATCSNGCIAATTNPIRDLLNQRLSQEEGQNTLQVVP